MSAMCDRPPLLRREPSSPRRRSITDIVSSNVRYQLAMKGMKTATFAEIAGISIGRARSVYYGRRPATLMELSALAAALDLPITEFLKELW